MAPGRGIDEAVVDAEGDVAGPGELLSRMLHVGAATGPHPTTMDEDHSRAWLPRWQRSVGVEQQRFSGDNAEDHAALHVGAFFSHAGPCRPRLTPLIRYRSVE